MKIDVLTLFPEMFTPVTEESILGRAKENGILDITLTNIRDHSQDKHKKADDYPFGGGAGMVMLADPVFRSLNAINAKGKRIIYMSPRGRILDHKMILELSNEDELVILCGHYEGVDQRIIDYWDMQEVSIGDYVLTGGELPAMVLIDSISRMLQGVLGSQESAQEESFSLDGLLEYPQFTRPREFRGKTVPEVLLNGNHAQILRWRREQAILVTRKRRPDMLEHAKLTDKERKWLMALEEESRHDD